MEEETKARLTNRNLWLRALYMVLFAIAYSLAEVLVAVTVIVQFLIILFTGRGNEGLLRFGHNLGIYINQIVQYVTFNSELQPFPFSDFPSEPPASMQWLEGAPAADEAGTGSERNE